MEIQEIKINNGNLINIDFDPIPYYLTNPSLALPPTVPVTVQLGTPIIQLPGCVEAHETANPKNTTITQDDKRGTLTFCDGSLPSFNPIQYEPNQMIMTSPDTVEPVKPSKPKKMAIRKIKGIISNEKEKYSFCRVYFFGLPESAR